MRLFDNRVPKKIFGSNTEVGVAEIALRGAW